MTSNLTIFYELNEEKMMHLLTFHRVNPKFDVINLHIHWVALCRLYCGAASRSFNDSESVERKPSWFRTRFPMDYDHPRCIKERIILELIVNQQCNKGSAATVQFFLIMPLSLMVDHHIWLHFSWVNPETWLTWLLLMK